MAAVPFDAVRVALGGDGELPIVAEDLGDIDDDVKALLKELGFPGMKVLQFAFDHLGARAQHVRLQVYGHHLGSTADVVEWVKGTSLTRIFKVLPADLHDRFV